MAKVRLEITKGSEIRYLSHLDYARAMERAVRRSKLPVAYSEGFNPHMKIAYATAMGVGVATEAEYVDIEWKEDVSLDDVRSRLEPQLPNGIVLRRLKFIGDKMPALMSVINLAVYDIEVPLTVSSTEQQVAASIELFNAASSVTYVRESPKGRRETDVKALMAEPVTVVLDVDKLRLQFTIHITKTGTIKASEVLEVLATSFGLPVCKDSAVINRSALFIADKERRLTPMEIV